MNEPTVHTFDLYDPRTIRDDGTVPQQLTHTLTALDLMINRERAKLTPVQRFIADSVTETTANLMLYGTPESPTLSPEWSGRLWELAQQPERPTLEPARAFPIHATPGQPIGWLLPRWDAFEPRGFVWYDRTVPPVDDVLMREIRRSAYLALLMEFELRASERENDLIYGSDPSRPAPLTDDEAYAKAEALLQRMIDEGEISFP